MEEERKEEALNPEDLMSMWEEALKESASSSAKKVTESPTSVGETSLTAPPKEETPQIKPSPLRELSPKEEGIHPELDFILDIPLEISVEIGRTKLLIKDLLKLNQGSVIELEKFAGEPVEIYVNGKLMARGEVVVVNERFGVRITEIISTQERIKNLGS